MLRLINNPGWKCIETSSIDEVFYLYNLKEDDEVQLFFTLDKNSTIRKIRTVASNGMSYNIKY